MLNRTSVSIFGGPVFETVLPSRAQSALKSTRVPKNGIGLKFRGELEMG